jgi:transcriptional regulator with XRE-family HTH domain
LDQAQHRTSGSPYLAAIAERIIRLRSVRGLTQTELARSAGVSRKTISRLERSRTMPTLDRLHQIAGALRVSLAELAVEPGDSKWDDQSSPPGDAESKERM